MRQQQTYSVSELMWNTLGSLVDDFHDHLPQHFCRLFRHLVAERDVDLLRSVEFDLAFSADSFAFKRCYQLATLCKRTILNTDRLTSTELIAKSASDFVNNQKRLETQFKLPVHFAPAMSFARGICHDILGEWSTSEHLTSCRNGRHAAVGVPLRLAKLDAKWCHLSGSDDHIKWFQNEYLTYHPVLRAFINEGNAEYHQCDSLQMTFVPKSYKSVRSITPNTVIGALHSDGIGKMIERRLRRHGLDVAVLQQRHRFLAEAGSSIEGLVTCDQSSASDNITIGLLEALLPQRWLDAILTGRISTVRMPDGSEVKLESACTMGIGFTFPLQTLIFYALAKGVDHQFNDGAGLVSCYGDDLIFDAKIWPFFLRLLPHIGLQINADKSFASGDFRESCGGDYHRGVDVRPFQPKWVEKDVVRRETFESLLYRFINGLRRRWDDAEIESTLLMLAELITVVTKRPCVVPDNFADDSGIRIISLNDLVAGLFDLRLQRNRNNALIFSYLRPLVKEGKVLHELPFLQSVLQDRPADLRERFTVKLVDSIPFVPLPGTTVHKRHRATTILL